MSVVKEVVAVAKEAGAAVNQSGIVDKVSAAIEQLAKGLGVASQHVYEVLIKQAFVSSVIYLVIYAFLFIAIVTLYSLGYKGRTKAIENGDYSPGDEDINTIFFIIGTLLSIMFLILFLCTVGTTVTGFLNPEYIVIKDVTDMLKAITGAK